MNHKLPRIYTPNRIETHITLDSAQTHYLKNVMRKNVGDNIRLFDGQTGEHLARIINISKKSTDLDIIETLKPQPELKQKHHLLFAPLAKNRMDILIEKSVELGITDFHPIITNRTEHRKINIDRITAQIIEAAEQCERMHIPALHAITPLTNAIAAWTHTSTIQWGCERDVTDRKPLGFCTEANQAFLIGPVGGFDDTECEQLIAHKTITPITMGNSILRAETAALLCASSIKLKDMT